MIDVWIFQTPHENLHPHTFCKRPPSELMISIRRLVAHRKLLVFFFFPPTPEKKMCWKDEISNSNNKEFYHQQSLPNFLTKKTVVSDLSVPSHKCIQERMKESSHFKVNYRNRQKITKEIFICTNVHIHVYTKKAFQKSFRSTLQHNPLCHWHLLLFIHSSF